MAEKPIILTVDDEAEVLAAVSRDVRKRYAKDYRILKAGGGSEALEAIQELHRTKRPVALIVSDQRMPGMSGVEFIAKALEFFPDCKRVLLTAYSDTEAAIQAINKTHVDHYLLKPWDPPENNLYPVLDDLLADWDAGYVPPFRGIEITGLRWSPETYQLREFLQRNNIPFRFRDVQQLSEAEAPSPEVNLPIVRLPEGETLYQPTEEALSERLGLQPMPESAFYDLLIVGGGPAGLAAAVYGASEGLRTGLIEMVAPGGQAGTSSRIENYLGFPSGLSGQDLARRAVTQAKKFGAEIISPAEVTGIADDGNYKVLRLSGEREIRCGALIIATGVQYRKLDATGIDEFTGRGVYYGSALAEASLCQGKPVYMVGGGNSAGQAAIYFAKYATEVNLVIRGADLSKSMSQYLIDQIEQTDNIHVLVHTEVTEAVGEDHLEKLKLINNQSREERWVEAENLFLLIGAAPRTEWLGDCIIRSKRGFVVTGPDLSLYPEFKKSWKEGREPFLLETSQPGIFAAGDVRDGSVKRVASGVGEGSIAISFVHQFLANR